MSQLLGGLLDPLIPPATLPVVIDAALYALLVAAGYAPVVAWQYEGTQAPEHIASLDNAARHVAIFNGTLP